MDRFGNDILSSLDVQYRCGYIIFDTGIGYDEYNVLIVERILIDAIKFISMSDYYISVFSVN